MTGSVAEANSCQNSIVLIADTDHFTLGTATFFLKTSNKPLLALQTASALLALCAGTTMAQTPAPATPFPPGAPAAAPARSAAPVLTPFSTYRPGALPAPWRVVGLPGNKAPLAQVEITAADGAAVLTLATDKSYGSAVHDLPRMALGADTLLRWRWKVAQPLAGADLRTKAGDDVALKVCALFDLPLDALPLAQRTLMRIARAVSGEPLPAASLCYVWDATLPMGTLLPNAFSDRVRYLVVNGHETPPGRWVSAARPLSKDFLLAFGKETSSVPPLVAIAVGADADNTGGRSLGYVGDVTLTP